MSIYLDHAATTPLRAEVLEAMLPYLTEHHGNASSLHTSGRRARQGLDEAREAIAAILGAKPREIVFTSGGSEADNLAIKGAAWASSAKGRHVVTSGVEHKAVLHACAILERSGFEVTIVPVDRYGRVDPAEVEAAIADHTTLVSIMYASNEVGTIQPIAEIGAICRRRGVLFHTDAIQAGGYLPLNVDNLGVDLLSLAAHKLYGPKGVGALFVRQGTPLLPQIQGGSQERQRRAGTENVAGIVGFARACELMMSEGPSENARIRALRDRLQQRLEASLEQVTLNGDEEHRLDGNLNLSFSFVEGEGLMMAIKDVAVSSGSACTSASLEPSYVLKAMGLDEELAHSSLRFGLGRFNTEAEVDYVADLVIQKVKKLRDISPLYEMHQQGIDIKSIQWAAH